MGAQSYHALAGANMLLKDCIAMQGQDTGTYDAFNGWQNITIKTTAMQS